MKLMVLFGILFPGILGAQELDLIKYNPELRKIGQVFYPKESKSKEEDDFPKATVLADDGILTVLPGNKLVIVTDLDKNEVKVGKELPCNEKRKRHHQYRYRNFFEGGKNIMGAECTFCKLNFRDENRNLAMKIQKLNKNYCSSMIDVLVIYYLGTYDYQGRSLPKYTYSRSAARKYLVTKEVAENDDLIEVEL